MKAGDWNFIPKKEEKYGRKNYFQPLRCQSISSPYLLHIQMKTSKYAFKILKTPLSFAIPEIWLFFIPCNVLSSFSSESFEWGLHLPKSYWLPPPICVVSRGRDMPCHLGHDQQRRLIKERSVECGSAIHANTICSQQDEGEYENSHESTEVADSSILLWNALFAKRFWKKENESIEIIHDSAGYSQ